MRAQTLRRFMQGFALAFVVFLFAMTAYPLRSPMPVDLLLRFDPLAAVVAFLSSRSIVPQMLLAMVLLGITFFLGRFFCGYLCPLGTSIDLFDGLISRFKLNQLQLSSVSRTPKYYLLAFLLLLALLGHSLLWLFDPLVIFTRSLVALFYPASVFLANRGLDFLRPLAERWQLDALADTSFTQPVFNWWIFPLILLIGILGLGLLGRRLWCRLICPLGAMLALVARFSPLRRVVRAGSCQHCGLCRKHCSMGAIQENEAEISRGECIECGLCASICPQRAVSFQPGMPRGADVLDWDRRRFVLAALVGIASISVSRIIPGPSDSRPQRLRPPGSVPEEVFLSRCLRCGECMKVCLTNGLQPSFREAGPEGLWTPVLVPRKGPCERHCHLCGLVCPTQAIRPLSLEEKSYARIGRAEIDRSRCLEWGYDKACLVCDEVCPYGAIFVAGSREGGKGRRGPVVDEGVCVGCGVCEHHCPVVGKAAIRVGARGEDRLLNGSYITSQKTSARQRALKEEFSKY